MSALIGPPNASVGGAPVDVSVGWAGRGQRAQGCADDLRGLAVAPSDQLTTTVAVP